MAGTASSSVRKCGAGRDSLLLAGEIGRPEAALLWFAGGDSAGVADLELDVEEKSAGAGGTDESRAKRVRRVAVRLMNR